MNDGKQTTEDGQRAEADNKANKRVVISLFKYFKLNLFSYIYIVYCSINLCKFCGHPKKKINLAPRITSCIIISE